MKVFDFFCDDNKGFGTGWDGPIRGGRGLVGMGKFSNPACLYIYIYNFLDFLFYFYYIKVNIFYKK